MRPKSIIIKYSFSLDSITENQYGFLTLKLWAKQIQIGYFVIIIPTRLMKARSFLHFGAHRQNKTKKQRAYAYILAQSLPLILNSINKDFNEK